MDTAASPLLLIAELPARAGRVEALVALAQPLIAASRAEPGCIRYQLHRALDDPSLLLFVETWQSREAFDRHMQTPYLQAFAGAAPEHLAGDMRLRFFASA